MFWMKKLAVGAMSRDVRGGRAHGGVRDASDGVASDRTSGNRNRTPDCRRGYRQKAGSCEAWINWRGRKRNSITRPFWTAHAPFDAAFLDKMAAADLGNDLAIVVTEGGRGLGWSKPPYTVREVVNGKVGEMQCYEMDI